jgi:secondary thiamine-phosphate synthase enzyme
MLTFPKHVGRDREKENPVIVRTRPFQIVTENLVIPTSCAPQFVDLTDQVRQIVRDSGIQTGQVLIFTKHTTAAIRINEAEPGLLLDFVEFLDRVAPEDGAYRHDDFTTRTVNMTENERANGHSHCRQLMFAASETVPVASGDVCLGTWQRVFLVELDHACERTVIVQVAGL